MPWTVKKKGSQYCVYKKGSSSPIKGGCHGTKAEAEAHKRALYANADDAAAKLSGPALVTIPNVPIVEAGYEWPAMTGLVTITREHLVDMVAASNDDPGIPDPRLKLTLVSDTHGEPITEPSFGRATNLRLDEDEQTIYADFEGVPTWLADVLPVAYPNRSVEIAWGVKTTTGGDWNAVLTAVQLLGVEWPGCLTLKDLPLYYGAEQPSTVTVKLGGGMGKTKAAVNVDDVRRSYYDELDGVGNYSWWIKGVLLDPNQLVVEDEKEGELYLVGFSITDDEVEFDEPSAVKVEYVPKPQKKEEKTKAAAFLAAGLMTGREVAASYANPEESGREVKMKGGMSVNDEQRKKLIAKFGLPSDATDEQINSKLLEGALEETPPDDDDDDDNDDDDKDPATPATPPTTPPAIDPEAPHPTTPQQEPVGATMSVDPGALAQLQRDAAMGRQARQEQLAQVKESLLSGAIAAGKFPPARKKYWADYYDKDPEGAKTHIEGMQANMIPIEERGVAGGGDGGESDLAATGGEAYPSQWFPEVARRKAALKAANDRGLKVAGEVS